MFKIQPLLDITVKEFVLSKSCSGYALRCQIYTGKNSFLRQKNVPLTEQVVTSLLDGYEGKGHVVYMDNFYSSPSPIFGK